MNYSNAPSSYPDPDREARLIHALNSEDKFEVERAIKALAQLRSSWAVENLSVILQGTDDELAKAAASALREIPGIRSAMALASGFLSPLSAVRAHCVYLVGEMSLFGRRDDALKVSSGLTSLIHDSHPLVRREAVHAMGKIGGDIAVSALVNVLSSPTSPADLKAYALHAPRKWSDQEIASFVSRISAIVRAYPEDLRREIRKQDIFQYAPSEIISLIRSPDEPDYPPPSKPVTIDEQEMKQRLGLHRPDDSLTSGQPTAGGSNEQRQATEKKDFFVSYNNADRTWAEWIAWQLEEVGYTTIIQAWDFRPGRNFVIEMQHAAEQARRTIAVLSPNYLQALYTQPEWTAAFAQDPTGEKGTLLPVRVRECELKGLLPQIVYIDLVGLDKQAAKKELLAGVKQGRAKPTIAPSFPGAVKHKTSERPDFPGEASSD